MFREFQQMNTLDKNILLEKIETNFINTIIEYIDLSIKQQECLKSYDKNGMIRGSNEIANAIRLNIPVKVRIIKNTPAIAAKKKKKETEVEVEIGPVAPQQYPGITIRILF